MLRKSANYPTSKFRIMLRNRPSKHSIELAIYGRSSAPDDSFDPSQLTAMCLILVHSLHVMVVERHSALEIASTVKVSYKGSILNWCLLEIMSNATSVPQPSTSFSSKFGVEHTLLEAVKECRGSEEKQKQPDPA